MDKIILKTSIYSSAFLVMFLACVHFGHAQKNTGDSLTKAKKLQSLQDSVRKYNRTDATKAIEFYKEARNLAQSLGDKSAECIVTNMAGSVYEQAGKLDMALKLFLEATDIAEAAHLETERGRSILNVGSLYTGMGQYNLALDYLQKALLIAEKANDSLGIAKTHNNIGNTYEKKSDWKKALQHYKITLAICEQKHIYNGISIVSNNIGNIHKELGQFNDALSAYNKALSIATINKDEESQAFFKNNIGALYMDSENYREALKYILEALPIAEKANDKSMLINVYARLAKAYSGVGKYKEAFEVQQKYIDLTEKIFNENSSAKIAEMQAVYESEKKEMQIRNLNIQNQQQAVINETVQSKKNVIIWWTAVGLGITLFFSFFLFRALSRSQKQKRIIELQNEAIAEKQKAILDSIHYAERIQKSLLPTDRYLVKVMKRFK